MIHSDDWGAVSSDALETLPAGAVVAGRDTRGDLDDVADFVVIGTGAAGASAAWALTEAGHSVVMIEEGPWVRTRELSPDLGPSMRTLFRGAGMQVAFGRSSLVLLQGRCVGGSTVVNSAIALRAPESVFDAWRRRHGVGDALSYASLEPHYRAVERAFAPRTAAADVLGEHNRLFGEAARRLGIQASPVPRYERGCEGSAECLTGCARGRKASTNVSLVPECLRRGARLYHDARVERVETRAGRAAVVVATMASESARRPARLRVHARRGVIVCASAVQTPSLLRRSGVRSPALGRHFQCHPGVSLACRMDSPVRMQFGATQGYNSTAFSRSHGFKLESVSLPPELVAMNLPGSGPELVRGLADYENLMCWAVALRADAEGRVLGVPGVDAVLFSPSRGDMERARAGLRVLTEMMFAVGAREVWPGVHGMPEVLRSPDEIARWDDAPLDPRAYNLVTSHMFGTARMGPDPRTSVVGTDFQVHGLPGLFVLDSSVFPTNLGVNPQHTIMAVARLGAERASDGAPRGS